MYKNASYMVKDVRAAAFPLSLSHTCISSQPAFRVKNVRDALNAKREHTHTLTHADSRRARMHGEKQARRDDYENII